MLLQHVLTTNDEVKAYAARAYSLASLANLDSELTCLRLDAALRVADRDVP